MAFVPPEGSTPVLSSPGSVIWSAMIMSYDRIDHQAQASSSASSVDVSSSNSTSNSNRHLPSPGPIIAGILVGIIAIVTIVVIYFVNKRLRRRRDSLEARTGLQPDLHPHQYSRNWFSRDEMPLENDPPQQSYHHQSRHSRHSRNLSGTMELNIRDSVPQIVVPGDRSRSTAHKSSLPLGNRELHSASVSTTSASSSTLYTNKTGVNKPSHQAVQDGRQTLVSDPPPPQPPSSSSQNELLNPLQHSKIRNNSLSPEVRRQQRLDALIQQRATLLASGNASDKGAYNERLLLDEQIQNLKRQDRSPPNQDDPPPYEGRR